MKDLCSRFERILKIIRKIRQIKNDSGIGCKIIDIGYIFLKNDEVDLAMTLNSIGNICRLIKAKSMIIVYFDEIQIENGMILYYNFEIDSIYVCKSIPNIEFSDIGNKGITQLFDLIKNAEFVHKNYIMNNVDSLKTVHK